MKHYLVHYCDKYDAWNYGWNHWKTNVYVVESLDELKEMLFVEFGEEIDVISYFVYKRIEL